MSRHLCVLFCSDVREAYLLLYMQVATIMARLNESVKRDGPREGR